MAVLKFFLIFFTLATAGYWSMRNTDFQGSRTSLTTNTSSSQFATPAEALQFLKPYLDLPSPVEDVAYHVIYHDNSRGLPGPSDWDIKVVAKVLPEQIKFWLEGFGKTEPFELSWGYALAETKGWTLSTEPLFYARSAERIAVFPQGLVFYWHSTLIN